MANNENSATSAIDGAHIIAGQPTKTSGQPVFQAVNPATGAPLPTVYQEATPEEIHRAVAAADAAFDEYRALPGDVRARFLEGIAAEIEALGDVLIQTAEQETALPTARLQGERGRTLNQIRVFADIAREGSWVGARIDHGDGARKPLPKPDVRAMLVPMGPIAVFGASNFPLAISVAGTDTISALAVGCPVVVKAHPSHPGTSALIGTAIARAVKAAQLPAGIFSMLHGRTHDVGLTLVRAPQITAVAFTGSERGGRALFDAAAARPHPIPVYAELGSVNPVFVLPEALADRPAPIAAAFLQSLTMGVGQFCTNPGLLFVCEGPGLDVFKKALADAVTAAAPASLLNRGIHDAFDEGTRRLAALPGVATLARSGQPAQASRCEASCTVFEVSLDTFRAHPALAHEVFGPSSVLVRCPDRAAMLEAARAFDGQLTASVHGSENDLRQWRDLLAILERKVGRLIVDGFATGIEVCAAMHHGGPYPAATFSQHTSIGHASWMRFVRPVAYQNIPDAILPPALQDKNPLQITRFVDGRLSPGGG